jgi:iron complex outermembrane recepter protein
MVTRDNSTRRILPSKRRCLWTAGVCGAVFVSLGGGAWAQEARPADSAAPAQLDEVVVTAQKRAQKVQDVGIDIDAFSGGQLKQLGVDQVTDLARVSPGVNMTGSYAGQYVSFVIRGVQQQDFQAIAEGPNAVYIDEGYVGIANDAAIGLFDIDNVEVLKGPQGTLFGRNATGGVVNIVTRGPTDTTEGFVDYTYGSYNTQRVEAAIGGPLTSDLSGRIAALYDSNGSWVKNADPNGGALGAAQNWAVRGKLEFKPIDGLDTLLTAFTTRSVDSWGPYFRQNVIPVYSASGGVINAVPTAANTGYGPNSNSADLTLDSHDAQSSGDFQDMTGVNLKGNYEAGDGLTLTSITDFKRFHDLLQIDDSVTPVFLLDSKDADYFTSLSQEFRAYKSWSNLRLTSGLYYLYMDNHLFDNQDWRGIGSTDIVSNAHLFTDAYAVFSQAEWDFAPQWTIVGGARFTDDTKNFRYEADNPYATPSDVRNYPSNGSSAHLNSNLVTGKLQIEYRPAKDTLIYAGYNRGAKAGSFNSPLHANSPPTDEQIPYKPEFLDSYEAGFKVDAWDGRVSLDGAVFYYNYHDAQILEFSLPLNSQIINAPTRTKGGELEVRIQPLTGVTLSGSIGYTDALVKGVVMNGNPPADLVPPLTPKIHSTLLGRYEWPMMGGSVAVQADAQYQSLSYLGLSNYEADQIAPYWLIGSRLSWTQDGGKWSGALSVENLADTRYRTVGFDLATYGWAQYAIGRPRWVKFNVARHF